MSCMFIPNFETICHVTLVLEPKTASQVWRKKSSLSKTALVRQKIFHTVICLKILFHPDQPTFDRDEVVFFPFLNFFFLPKSCTLFLNHKTSKSNFCVKLLRSKRNFVSQSFFGQFLQKPLKMGPQKSIF